MKTIKTEAILIGERSLPNKDKILIFFTPILGKIRVFAKGIKKITSRRLSHLDTGNLIKIVLSQKKEFFYLHETELISGFSQLKKDKKKIAYLYFFFYLLNKILPDNQNEAEVYRLTKKFLIDLGQKKPITEKNFLDYLNRLLIVLGYSTKELSFYEAKKMLEQIINEKLPSFEYN